MRAIHIESGELDTLSERYITWLSLLVAKQAGYTVVIDSLGYGSVRLEYTIDDAIEAFKPEGPQPPMHDLNRKVLFLDGSVADTKKGAELMYLLSVLAREARYDYIQDTRGMENAIKKYHHYAVYYDPMVDALPF